MVPKQKRKIDEEVLAKVRHEPCVICGGHPVDACHIVSRGAGGPDESWNVIPLCRNHHQMQHKLGFVRMMEKFPPLNFRLKKLGWTWIMGRMWNAKLSSAF